MDFRLKKIPSIRGSPIQHPVFSGLMVGLTVSIAACSAPGKTVLAEPRPAPVIESATHSPPVVQSHPTPKIIDPAEALIARVHANVSEEDKIRARQHYRMGHGFTIRICF